MMGSAGTKEQELIRDTDRLKQGTIGECRSLIEELGRYYQGVIPSTVNEDLIVKTEEMLTNLRRNFDESLYRPALKRGIRSALGIASALSYEIRYKSSRSEEFFERVPKLGDKLLALDKAIDIATK